MTTLKSMITRDIVDLIDSRSRWQPGDYVNPCIIGDRLVLKITERHADRFGVMYMARDSHGHEMEVYVSDDPRRADHEQIEQFRNEQEEHEADS